MADLQLQQGEGVVYSTNPGSWLTSGMYFWSLGLYHFWRKATHYAVTDQRVILAKGIVSKQQRSLPVDMVQDASVGSVFGIGSVTASTAGGELSTLKFSPMKSQDAHKMSEVIIQERNTRRSAPTPSSATSTPPAASGSADRLRDLERLHSDGLIDDDEYRDKRSEILKDL